MFAVLVSAHDEWQVSDRRYLSEGSMALLTPAEQAARGGGQPALIASWSATHTSASYTTQGDATMAESTAYLVGALALWSGEPSSDNGGDRR
jgi:hypothetical protein